MIRATEDSGVERISQTPRDNKDGTSKNKRRRSQAPNKTSPEQAQRARTAAKARRDNEQVEHELLTSLLPFDQERLAKVDKTSTIQLVLAYIQTKNFLADALKDITDNVETMSLSATDTETTAAMKAEEGHMMMEALDGFLIFVGKNGRIGFVSEQVEKHVGVSALELMTMSVLDMVHSEDQTEFLQQFQEDAPPRTTNQRSITSLMDLSDSDDNVGTQGTQPERVFYVRIKCHLAKPGSRTKQHGHILTQWSGRLQCRVPPQGGDSVPVGLVAVVRPVHSEPLVEIRLDGNMFVSRHDLGLRFTFCDPRILNLIGYDPDELMGKSTYQFNYPTDALKIQNCHSHLIAKGTCVSKYYRFLGKNGQWIWMKTRATIIYNSDNEPQYVVCLNYVYSEEEGKRCLLLEEENCDASCANIPGYIDINSLGGRQGGANGKHCPEPNNNYQVTEYNGTSCPAVSGSNNLPSCQSGHNSGLLPTLPPVSEAVLDHTYPATPTTSIPHCGDLPAGLAASGFPQFVQQNFLDNTAATLEDTDWSSWLDGLTGTLNLDAPADITGLNINDTMASTTMVNRDYRLAVSDHDYSAKPESEQDHRHANGNDDVFTNSEGLLLESLDEMMDTDFLDTVSFGRTNYDDSQSGLLGSILSKSGLNMTDELDETHSLLDAIGEGQNGLLRGLQPQSASMSVTQFPSNHMDAMSATDSFAAKFAQSLLDEEAKGVSYSLGQTDPCLGVTSLQHIATTTTFAKNGKKNFGLEQNLNQHTLGLVDTPPPSPKPIRSGGKPNYLSMHKKSISGSKHTSPSTSPPVTDLSASLSSLGSSHKSKSQPSSSSPPHSRSLSKSWPNAGKPSRNRNGSSSGGSGRHRGGSSASSSHKSSSSRSSEHKGKAAPTLLEQFLTTKQRINPNRGSDNVFARSRVTDRISKLHIDRQAATAAADDPNLLQQLLTGKIDGNRVHQYEQRVIKTRRHDSLETTPVTSPLTSPLVSDVDLDSDSLVTDTTSLESLFDSNTDDMGSFFEPLSPDVDVLMHSDLDDILREQSRQEDLWLRQYVS